jgi:hypothetical protein
MKKRNTVFSLAALSVVAFAFAQDEFVVRRELKEGAKDAYKVTTKVSQTMTPSDPNQAAMVGGEMKFDMSMSLDMRVSLLKLAEDKKSADVEMAFENIVYDFGAMAGMVPQENLPKSIKATGKMDDRSRLLDFKMPDLPAALAGSRGMMGPMMVELPEKAIKVGDTWDMPLPTAEMLGAKDGKMVAKLVALEEYEKIPALVVDLSASIPIDADLSQMAAASGAPPMKVLAKGKFDMKGRAIVDRATGKTLKMDLNFDTTSHVIMPEVGVEFDSVGVGTSGVQIVIPK